MLPNAEINQVIDLRLSANTLHCHCCRQCIYNTSKQQCKSSISFNAAKLVEREEDYLQINHFLLKLT